MQKERREWVILSFMTRRQTAAAVDFTASWMEGSRLTGAKPRLLVGFQTKAQFLRQKPRQQRRQDSCHVPGILLKVLVTPTI
jgi:hypothetical protein